MTSSRSPNLGLSYLQFETRLTAAHAPTNMCDFAWVPVPGLLGSRIFDATGLIRTHVTLRSAGPGASCWVARRISRTTVEPERPVPNGADLEGCGDAGDTRQHVP